MKANFNSHIIQTLAKLGSGVDVVSKGELEKCLINGVEANKVVFSGVGKTEKEIEFALKKQIKQINAESLEELEEIEEICKKVKHKNKYMLKGLILMLMPIHMKKLQPEDWKISLGYQMKRFNKYLNNIMVTNL